LTVLSANPGTFTATTGGGLSGGMLSAVGMGQGAAGSNAVFGPSLAGAIAAQTPVATPAPTPEPTPEEMNSKGGNNNPVITAAPAAPTAPMFFFQQGLPTGGGGGGFGFGSGITTGAITSPANVPGQAGNTQFFADEAYGTALANGFGFGVASGVAINVAGEQAGGTGGGSSFGQGVNAFELDDIQAATFGNSGSTISSGGAGAYVGFAPPTPVIFGSFIGP
jgi:hypothetical protein